VCYTGRTYLDVPVHAVLSASDGLQIHYGVQIRPSWLGWTGGASAARLLSPGGEGGNATTHDTPARCYSWCPGCSPHESC
jgi:hypothetical protein